MRFIEDKDYKVISEWWKGYNWPAVPKEALPKNGFIVDGLCAGFLYCTDSSIAWMEFIVGNPAAIKEDRTIALNNLVISLCGLAKEYGYKQVFSSIQHPNLMKIYEDNGFEKSDVNMTNFVRRI